MRRAAALLLALPCTPAFAHANFGDIAPFWAGALHVLVTPLALAALLALACGLVALPDAQQFRLALLAGLLVAAISIVLALLPTTFAAAALLAAAGALLPALAAAFALSVSRASAVLLVAAAASAASLSAAPEPGAWGAALGAGACACVVLLWLQEGLRRLAQRLPLTPRVLGAWVAAIAVLLGALEFALPRA
ncbi:MAG: hypothetical protein MUC68_14410 [Burkholderiaceae bacterium]|jgi:hypothetical protein|nr:hypothetical protein [Burkholderiaceae bacterium]